MSYNELEYDKSNMLLRAERNYVNKDGSKNFNINYKAMAHDDPCFVDIETRQSIGKGNYFLTNLYDGECMIPQTIHSATDNVCVPFKNGYGTEQPCVVDDGTKLRIGLTKQYPKCPQQLFTRPYNTIPYMGKGYLKPNEETTLLFSEDTRVKKSCNTLSEITIPHQYTPMIGWLSESTQNPEHIIQEVIDPTWRWGGINSRNIVKDFDYSIRCDKAYMNKTTNQDFWQEKSQLL